jgi:hypothetical protein
VLLMQTSLPGSENNIFTGGAGASLKDAFTKGLEVFFEFYYQTGQLLEIGGQSVDLQAYAFNIGFRFAFESSMKPWVEAQILLLSGDSDQSAGDTDVESFLSYESRNDLMILMSQFYGLDWESNFLGILLSGGLSFNVGSGTENLHLTAVLGIMRSNEDVLMPDGPTDKLGNEFDATASFDVNKQVQIVAGVAALFGSDILEGLGGGSNDPDAEDSSFLFHWGVHARF